MPPKAKQDESLVLSAHSSSQSLLDEVLKALLDRSVMESIAKQITPIIESTVKKCVAEEMMKFSTSLSTTEKASETALSKANSCCNDVAVLSNKLNDLENYLQRDNLIIQGVPRLSLAAATSTTAGGATLRSNESSEELTTYIIKLCSDKLNITVTSSDISTAHRLRLPSSQSGTHTPQYPPSIIVRFTNRRTRDSIYRARTQLKGTKIFINEQLSTANNLIFKKAREMKKMKAIFTCWSFNGEVFVRRSNTPQCSPLCIKSINDL